MRPLYTLLLAALAAAQAASAQAMHPAPGTDHKFIVCSHRGDHEHAPENTLAAFRDAIKAGADYIEIDLRTTVDSQLVIMHDASVDRMTDGKGLVKDLTFDYIRKLKVRGTEQVPTFREVLALAKGKINIYLDFKNASPAVAYRQILDAGMEQNVVVYINAVHQFYEWRRAAPQMPLMVSLPDSIKTTASMQRFLDMAHPEVLDGDWDQYTPDMVKTATGQGYVVVPDIEGPNEKPALWDQALALGFAGLQTDHPEELIPYLQSKGLR